MTYLSYFIILMTTGLMPQPKTNIKTYPINKIEQKLSINGKGDDPLWKKAKEISDFTYPWEKENPPLTKFKALHNADWIYFFFNAQDDNINVYVDKNDKSEVGASDRVEIFLRIDERMSPYYGLEMDPNGRVMDYQAEYHRKFLGEWSWPKGELIIKTNVRKDGYTVELAISKKSLKALGLIKGKTLEAGLYRGNCIELKGKDANLKWISWIKPDSETPDFHIPSSFGVLSLED